MAGNSAELSGSQANLSSAAIDGDSEILLFADGTLAHLSHPHHLFIFIITNHVFHQISILLGASWTLRNQIPITFSQLIHQRPQVAIPCQLIV